MKTKTKYFKNVPGRKEKNTEKLVKRAATSKMNGNNHGR
jgi:hypothetical protein